MTTASRTELRLEVEDFLYHEARLLDERRFHEWLDLFTEDVVYWMPTRSNRLRALVGHRSVLSCPGPRAKRGGTITTAPGTSRAPTPGPLSSGARWG